CFGISPFNEESLSRNLVGRDGIVNREEAVCRLINAQLECTSVEHFELHPPQRNSSSSVIAVSVLYLRPPAGRRRPPAGTGRTSRGRRLSRWPQPLPRGASCPSSPRCGRPSPSVSTGRLPFSAPIGKGSWTHGRWRR